MALPSELRRVQAAIDNNNHKELEWSLWYARMRQSVSSARPADVKYWSAVERQVQEILTPPPPEKVYPTRKKKAKTRGLGLGPLAGLIFAAALVCCTAQAQQMAVTFDDLPAHGERPPEVSRVQIAQSILATLKREKMPPVYGFINGKRIEEDPASEDVLRVWREAGEPLGNHTWSHLDLEKNTPADFEAQVVRDEPLLKKWMGNEDWHWFRYPFLHEGETLENREAVRSWLLEHGYRIAQVTMDFEDYLWNSPYSRCVAKHDEAAIQKLQDSYLATADEYITVFRKTSQMVYGRDVKYILLLHVGAFDARMLPELLALYRSRGFSFISLPEAAGDPVYREDPGIGYRGGGTQLELMMAKLQLNIPANSKPYKELEATCK